MTADPTKQPLYVPPGERVSLGEVKQRASEVSNLAVLEAKEVAGEVWEQNVTKAALVALGVVVVAASVAYYLGARAARRALEAELG